MKKIVFLPILLMMPLVACGEGDQAPETPTNWSVDVKAEMNDNIGEVLPYVSFGEGFYHSWTASSSVYSIGDTSSTNVLSGYGAKLEAKGWVEYNSKDEITYKKQNDKGYLTLKAIYSSGNKITVTVRDSEDVDPVGEEWPEAVKSQMLQYLGEVLPYAAFDESTLFYELYYEYTMDVDDVDGYNWYIQDDNETNVLSNYGEKLLEAGFTYGTDTYGDPVYYKIKTNGDELDIYFDWYPSEVKDGETIPAGNQIDCYFYRGEGGVDPTPTSGSVEIVIGNIPGYAHDSEFGTRTIDPGVTIKAEKGSGSTAPRFWTNDSEKQFRIYAGSTMTISAEGITKIEFTWTTKNSPTLSAATGTMSGTTWTGSASSIKFTVGGSGHLRITKIVVYGEFAGGGEGGDPVDPPAGEYTPLSVAQDLDMWMWPTDYDLDNDFEGPDANGVVECKYADWYDENIENAEECLRSILESVLSSDGFPSYLTVDSDIEYDAENSQVYIFFATPDEEVAACIYAIYKDGEIGVSFEAAPYDYYLVEE